VFQLEILLMSRNRIFAEGVSHLARLFKDQTELKCLDISSNSVNSGSGFNDLFLALAKCAGNLLELNIS